VKKINCTISCFSITCFIVCPFSPIILIIKKSEAVGLVLVVYEALDHWTVDTLRP